MAQNPSIVNDTSGNNYNIGEGLQGGLVDAQMSYLENLSNLIQKKPLSQDQYFPGYDQGLAVGNVSGSIIGNQPIFAAGGGLIPFGILDEMERAKSEAEANYYNQIKKELDDPLYTQKIVAADPFMQPEFSQKIMDITDKYLNLYTQRLGGDVTKAYVATKYDRNFQKEIRMMAEYADMYKTVYDESVKIKSDLLDPDKYVPEDAKNAVKDFMHNHEYVKDFSPDKLHSVLKRITRTLSATKLAESLTSGIKDDIVEKITPDVKISTDEQDVYRITSKTNEGLADQIIKDGLEAHPELKNNPAEKAVFERSVRGRINESIKVAITQVKKNLADRNNILRKQGIIVDDQGNMKFSARPAAVVNASGTKAVSYPVEARTKKIPSYAGMTGYIRVGGKLKQVKLPESYDMTLGSEYDIVDKNSGVEPGRYVEATLNIQSIKPYVSNIYKSVNQTIVDIGDTKSTTQVFASPLQVLNSSDPGETQDVMGPTTILVPFDQLKTTVEANIPYMADVHEALENQPMENTFEVQTYGSGRKVSKEDIIPLTDKTGVDEINPDQMYVVQIPGHLRNGETISGQSLLQMIKKNQDKQK